MNETKERRHERRQIAEGVGFVTVGQEKLPCRVIDISETGAQVRVDGRRASRNLMGKRLSLARDGAGSEAPLGGRVVWVRPAVNGVYLGIELDRADGAASAARPQVGGEVK